MPTRIDLARKVKNKFIYLIKHN